MTTSPPRRQFATDYCLWAVAAGCLFVGLGFLDVSAGVGKGDGSLWAALSRLVTGRYSCPTSEIASIVALQSLFCAAPAVLLGWVTQGILVVVRRPQKVRTV